MVLDSGRHDEHRNRFDKPNQTAYFPHIFMICGRYSECQACGRSFCNWDLLCKHLYNHGPGYYTREELEEKLVINRSRPFPEEDQVIQQVLAVARRDAKQGNCSVANISSTMQLSQAGAKDRGKATKRKLTAPVPLRHRLAPECQRVEAWELQPHLERIEVYFIKETI